MHRVKRRADHEGFVADQKRDGVVATARAGHFLGTVEALDNFKRAALTADGPGADARSLQTALSTGKVVIEGDRAVQVGQGDAQLLADGFDCRG